MKKIFFIYIIIFFLGIFKVYSFEKKNDYLTKTYNLNNFYEGEKIIFLKEINIKKNKKINYYRMSPISENNSIKISTMSYFNPIKGRDPTLSPMDYYLIKKEQEKIENEKNKNVSTKEKNKDPKTFLKLQGIIGKTAIINGEMINQGQIYRGIKLLKVGYDYVLIIYNDKRYKIKMN